MNCEGKYKIRRDDLLYPKLSYIINGILFTVHNTIGGGHKEKYYQKAVAAGLKAKELKFSEQHYTPLKCFDELVGKYFLDFLIEDKIILELKRGRYVPKTIFNQTEEYLHALDLKLAIIACFAQDCVVIKRIVNHDKL